MIWMTALRIVETILGVSELALKRSRRADGPAEVGSAPHASERAQMAIEQERLTIERAQADEARRLAGVREVADREAVRLRILLVATLVIWIVSLAVAGRATGGRVGAQVLLGIGWLVLAAALGTIISASRQLSRLVARAARVTSVQPDGALESISGRVAGWLVVSGFVLTAAALLAALR
jgi:hypothetical protein